MAKTLKRGTCTAPGCGATCTGGRCDKHKRPVNRSGADPRPYASKEFQQNRKIVLSRHPICRICKKWPSKIVDHVNGIKTDNRLTNLQGLCYGCNTSKG